MRLKDTLMLSSGRSWFSGSIYFILACVGIMNSVFSSAVMADVFGSGEHQFELPFVTIGNPGNPDDTTGDPNPAGRVDYVYRIGQFEVPEEAITKAVAASAAAGNPLNIALSLERGPQKPATSLTWFQIARFVNWLNAERGAPPAYKFNDSNTFQLWQPGDVGFDPDNRFRNSQSLYFLPSMDEWYKAAYYDPVARVYWDYPTGSDDPPTPVVSGTDPGTAIYQQVFAQGGPADVMLAGGTGPYGTVGQAGNVGEWEESEFDLNNNSTFGARGVRGGSWSDTIGFGLSSGFRVSFPPDSRPQNGGFRVASVPEVCNPASFVAMVSLVLMRRRRIVIRPIECSIRIDA